MTTKEIYDKENGWEETIVFEQFEIRALQMAGVSDDCIESLFPQRCNKEELDKRFGKFTYDTFCERHRQAREQLAKFWRRNTEDSLINTIRTNKALYWVETSATLTSVFKKCGAIPLNLSMVKYLLKEQVTPSQDGYRYMHPEQETANLGAWKTLFLLPSLDVYDAAYKRIGGKDFYEIKDAKDADRVITSIYDNIFEDQIYEIFPKERNAVEKASWFLKNDKDSSIDNDRKAELLNEVDYYLSGHFASLQIHPIPKEYLNTVEDEYGVIFDEDRKRIVGLNKEKFSEHQSYQIPDTVEYIDDDIFYCNQNLKHIDLGKVRIIGDNQFLHTSLEELIVPETVEHLGACICEGCKYLYRVEFKGNLNYLDIACFNGCTVLEEVTLPKDLIGLSDNVFSGTYSLLSLTLEEGLRFIGGECFMASGIKSLIIPSTVMEIAEDAFLNKEDIEIKIECPPDYLNMPVSLLKTRPMPAWMYIERFQECWILQLLKSFAYVVEVKSSGNRKHLLKGYKQELKKVLKWINAVEIEVEYPYYTLTTALTTMNTEAYDIVHLLLSVFNAMYIEDWTVNQEDELAIALMFKSQLPEMYKLIEKGNAEEIDKYVDSLGKFTQPDKEDIKLLIEQCKEHLVFNPVDPRLLFEQERPSDETLRQMQLWNSPVRIPLTSAWADGPSMTTTVGTVKTLIRKFKQILKNE